MVGRLGPSDYSGNMEGLQTKENVPSPSTSIPPCPTISKHAAHEKTKGGNSTNSKHNGKRRKRIKYKDSDPNIDKVKTTKH